MQNPVPCTSRPAESVWALRLPEVSDLGAIQTHFRFATRSGARRAVLRGDFGPWLRIGRRFFLRRVSILDALLCRERQSSGLRAPGSDSRPAQLLEILRSGDGPEVSE